MAGVAVAAAAVAGVVGFAGAVTAGLASAFFSSFLAGSQQSKIATHIAVLNEVEFENKSLGGLINGDYELTCLYGSQRANQKGNIILFFQIFFGSHSNKFAYDV